MTTAPNTIHRLGSVATIAAMTLFLFSATIPENHSEAEDGYAYALAVETGAGGMYHPHHLIFLPLMRMLFLTGRNAFGLESAFSFMVGVSMVCGAGAAALFFVLLTNRGALCRHEAMAVTAILVGSYGFWRYACEAEIYIPALCVALVPLALVTRRRISAPGLCAAVPAASLAALLHVVAAIPAIAVAAVVLWQRDRRRYAIAHAVFATLLLALGYLAFLPTPAPGSVAFPLALLPHGLPGPVALLHGSIGLGQCIVSGNFLCRFELARRLLADTFPERMLAEEFFMGEQGAFTPAWIASALLLTIACVVVVAFRRALASVPYGRIRHHLRDTIRACRPHPRMVLGTASALWLLTHGLVVLAFEPANPEMWTMAIPPCVVWLGLLVHPRRRAGFGSLYALAILMLAHNYFGGMYWIADRKGDYCAQKAEWFVRNATSDDIVLSSESPVFIRHLRYRQPAEVISLMETQVATSDRIGARIGAVRGNVYATAEVFSPPAFVSFRYPHAYRSMTALGSELYPHFSLLTTNRFGGVFIHSASRGMLPASCRPPGDDVL